MAHDVARSRREPGGNPRRSVVFPEEGVVVHVRGWIGPRADSAGGVQAGMVQVETDLGEDRDPKGFHGSAPHRGPWEGTAQAGQEIGTRAKGYRLFLRPRVARLPSDVVRD